MSRLSPAAQIVLRQIRAHWDELRYLEDLAYLRPLALLGRDTVDAAVAELVELGILTDDAMGVLLLDPRRAA